MLQVCALSLLLAASCVCWFKSRRQRLTDEELWQAQQEANRQSKLRDEERKGYPAGRRTPPRMFERETELEYACNCNFLVSSSNGFDA